MSTPNDGAKIMAVLNDGAKIMAVLNDGAKVMAAPNIGAKVMAAPNIGAKVMAALNMGIKVMAALNDGAKVMAAPNNGAKAVAASNEGDEEMITPNEEASSSGQWSQEDILNLLQTMKSVLPCQDSTNFKTTESHLDWSKLAFKNYTGSMCRQKWTEISNKVRKFRTLTELIQEAEEHFRNPSKGKNLKKHPDFLKKPLTPYFRFLMEKKGKYVKLYPDMSSLDLTKILSKKYKELSEEKKMKYMQDFQREKQDFERNLARFREEHPSLGQSTKKLDIPEKPKTPQQLWFDHKKTVHLKLKPNASNKDVKDALGKQWSQLSDKKRLKWILKALEQQKLYENKMRVFIQEHPEVKIPQENINRSILTKAERQLKDKLDGRPSKLPPNSYAMYCAEQRAKMKDVPRAKQMALCSQQWKLLSQQDKDAYQKKLEQKKKEYQLELMSFLKTLPEGEQQRVLAEEKMVGLNEKVSGSQMSKLEVQDTEKAKGRRGQPEGKKAVEKTVALPESSQAAEKFWQQSVIGKYLARCNNDQAEALKHMEATWINMKKKDKIIWIKKAAQDYKRYERELQELSKINKLASDKTTSKKKGKLQEPEKIPVQSSEEQATDMKKNPSKRKSTMKLKGPNPKSRAVSRKTSVDDDKEEKGNDNKSGPSSLPWFSED